MTAPLTPPEKSEGSFRWVICLLLFFSVAINYIDRILLSILKEPLSQQFGWGEDDYGYIGAAFSFAYAFGYLIGGRWMDRLGVKLGLPLVVLSLSLASAVHGLMGFIGVDAELRIRYPWFSVAEGGAMLMTLAMPMTAAGFILARIAFGVTSGGNFPGAIKAVAEWYPVKERALATGWFNTGTNVGAIVCPIAVPSLYLSIGWQATFYLTGLLGLGWVAAWWLVYETPGKHPRLSESERHYILEGQPIVEEPAVKVPWLALLKYRAVWAYICASVLAAPAWGFYQLFLPDFLTKRFDLDLQDTGTWTAVFFAIATVGGVLGGWFAGSLMKAGWTTNAARKLTLLICALAVVPVMLAPLVSTIWLAVLIVGIAGSAHQGWSANLFSVVSDTMPRETISSVVGLGGFLSYFTTGVVSAIVGKILEATGSYVWVFAYFSGMYLLSLVIIQILVPRIGLAKAK